MEADRDLGAGARGGEGRWMRIAVILRFGFWILYIYIPIYSELEIIRFRFRP